jgi:hypothetical protein
MHVPFVFPWPIKEGAMRRVAFCVVVYVAGVLTLPASWLTTPTAVHPPRLAAQQVPRPIAARQAVGAAGGERRSSDVTVVQAVPTSRAVSPAINFVSDQPPLTPFPADIGTVVFDEPMPERATTVAERSLPLPVRGDMLLADVPDAAEAENLPSLRGKLRTVIEEKAGLLNAAALEAEIALHERQIMELKALQELRRLQQSLQELSDKYPNSDAGRRAQELLDVLRNSSSPRPIEQPFGPAPTYVPGNSNGIRPQPTPDVFDRPIQPAPRPQRVPSPADDEVPFNKTRR